MKPSSFQHQFPAQLIPRFDAISGKCDWNQGIFDQSQLLTTSRASFHYVGCIPLILPPEFVAYIPFVIPTKNDTINHITCPNPQSSMIVCDLHTPLLVVSFIFPWKMAELGFPAVLHGEFTELQLIHGSWKSPNSAISMDSIPFSHAKKGLPKQKKT